MEHTPLRCAPYTGKRSNGAEFAAGLVLRPGECPRRWSCYDRPLWGQVIGKDLKPYGRLCRHVVLPVARPVQSVWTGLVPETGDALSEGVVHNRS